MSEWIGALQICLEVKSMQEVKAASGEVLYETSDKKMCQAAAKRRSVLVVKLPYH